MSDNLTQLTSKIQAILGDNGTIFTANTCTAAIRQALHEWNLRIPMSAAITIAGVNNQHEYELTDVDTTALDITDVLLEGPGNNEIDISLDFDSYIEDERVFFRLRRPVTSANTLIVRYTQDHTISGLDSATESTIANRWNQAIVDGGAYFAIFIRAVSRVESINLSQDQSDNYREMSGYFGSAFALRMAQASKRNPPVSEPDTRSWNDEYHSWGQ